MDFVMVAEVAMVAILPNIARVAIEERVVAAAVPELDTGEAALRHDGLGVKDGLHDEHREKQSDAREDRLCIKVSAHGERLHSVFPQIAERSNYSIFVAHSSESSLSSNIPG
jgi:hypothetical protein